jgi:hypothetical protein
MMLDLLNCILTPADCHTVHTQNESMAAGTAFAISYQVSCLFLQWICLTYAKSIVRLDESDT